MDKQFLKVPVDPRGYMNGSPKITNKMKAECIGEFSFDLPTYCSACAINGADENCEDCGGELEYTRTVNVPWNTCKEIYKKMALVAASDEEN